MLGWIQTILIGILKSVFGIGSSAGVPTAPTAAPGTNTQQLATTAFVIANAGGGTPTSITVANEATDTTCFLAFFTAAAGDLGPKTNSKLTFDSSTGDLVFRPSLLITNASMSGGGNEGVQFGAATGDIAFGDRLNLGNGFPFLHYNRAQTPDTLLIGLGSLANSLIICRGYDTATFDFAHALQTDPTIFIHSHNSSTSQWIGITHDGTNAVIQVGAGCVKLKNAAGGSLGSVGGCIFDHFADGATTNTDGTEDDLYSDTTVANTLAVNGDKVRGHYTIIYAGHAVSTDRTQGYFAGTKILDSGSINFATAGSADIWLEVIRESSTVVRVVAEYVPSGLSLQPIVTYTRITGLTLTATNIIKITGIATGTNSAAGDITAKRASIDAIPAA